ncbi:MAG: hypothetical protein Q9167_005507 [Letrouitia subvulpina]
MPRDLLENEYDLEQAWDQACQSFVRIAKLEIRSAVGRTPEDVILLLNNMRDRDAEKSAKYQKLKDVLGKSLDFIMILGSMAAQSVSMVFGPVNLCFNAISYLITAGQNYRNIFSSLTELLNEVSDALERFVLYFKTRDLIEAPLRKILCETLFCFTSICALSIKVLHGNKFVKFLKVFAFNEDEGVKAELDKLRKLFERESQMKSTLTYKLAKEGNAQTSQLMSSIRSVVDDNNDRKQYEEISSKLGVQKEADEQRQLHKRFWSERVDGTGQWLSEEPDYAAWSDQSTAWSRVLLLSGDEGYGKSFLITNVIHDLQKRYKKQTGDSSPRTSIAYYYLQSKESHQLEKGLKTMALQLTQDPVYRKNLAAICHDWTEEPESTQELFFKLWHTFFQGSGTCYLVLDGLDQIEERELQAMSQVLKDIASNDTYQRSHVRILLAGRTQALRVIADDVCTQVAEIKVASKNRQDIEQFIRNRLGSMKLLKGDATAIQTLREEIFSKLSEGTNGDFINTDLLLKEIGTKQWPREIRDVLANARYGNQRSDTIGREIERCNENLTAQERKDLSTLLLWVICCKRTLRVSELDAVLYLNNSESSLRPLHEQIEERYSAFFYLEKINSDADSEGVAQENIDVKLVSDSIRDYFQDRATEEARADVRSDRVNESEIKMAKRILTSFCDEDLYQKFGFEEFLNKKLNTASTATAINVQLNDAPTAILLNCLKIIVNSGIEGAQALLPYASTYFSAHLNDIDLSMTVPNQKINVGRDLIAVFTREEAIARWWTSSNMNLRFEWFYSDQNVDTVLTWFKDSAVTKGFLEKDKDWVESRTNPRVKPLTRDATKDDVSADVIYQIAEWTAEQTGTKEPNFEWVRCLAKILRDYSHFEASIKEFQHAATLKEDHWFADSGLAVAYCELQNWQAAIDTLESLLTRIASGEARDPDPAPYLRENRIRLAQSYKEFGAAERALKVYDQQLESDPGDYETIMEKIDLLRSQEKDVEIIAILQHLQKQTDPFCGTDRLTVLCHVYAFVDNYHEIITLVGRRLNSLDIVSIAYQKAIQDTEQVYFPSQHTAMATSRIYLTFWHARALSIHTGNKEAKQEASKLWEQCVADAVDVGESFIRNRAVKQLSRIYLDKLREINPDSTESDNYLQKLSQLSVNDSLEIDAYQSTLNTGLLLGRYYSTLGQLAKAKDCIKTHISIGLDLLSDESPENDWQGYLRLGTSLMYFGDEDNSLAAWSLIGPITIPLNDSVDKHPSADMEPEELPLDDKDKENDKATDNTTVDDPGSESHHGPLPYVCDGKCGRQWKYADDIYVCKDCLDVMFDERCLKKLRSDELETNVCNPKHEFMYVPSWDETEAKERGSTNARLRGEIVPVTDWLESIRRQFGLESQKD